MSARGGAVLGAQTIRKVKMPNRDGFIPPDVSRYKPKSPVTFTAIPDPAPQKT